MMADQLGIALRFALFVDLLTLFGWAAFGLYAPRCDVPDVRTTIAHWRWFVAGAFAGLLLSALGLAATASAMADVPIGELDWASVRSVLTDTSFGTALVVRSAALVLAIAAAVLVRGPAVLSWIMTLALGVAVASLAWGGHGVMNDGPEGWVHLSFDLVHLLAAGLWIGALLALLLLLFRPFPTIGAEHLEYSQCALAGFSSVGTILVAAIAVSGIMNGWFLVGPSNLGALWTTTYGALLVAKIGLFVGMLGLAAANRFRLTPSLARAIANGQHREAIGALRRSLALEAGCAVVILGIVAWLGTLEPPASAMAM